MICNFKIFKSIVRTKKLKYRNTFVDQCHAYLVPTFPTLLSHISSFILLKQVKQPILHSNKEINQPSFSVGRDSFVKSKLLESAIKPLFSWSFSFSWYFSNQMSSFRYTNMISRYLHKC